MVVFLFVYKFLSTNLSALSAALKKKEAINNRTKITNSILAIPAEAAATPVKPNIPAMIASIKNVSAQESIVVFN